NDVVTADRLRYHTRETAGAVTFTFRNDARRTTISARDHTLWQGAARARLRRRHGWQSFGASRPAPHSGDPNLHVQGNDEAFGHGHRGYGRPPCGGSSRR